MTATSVSPDSWQYRQLDQQAPILSTPPDALVDLAAERHPIIACATDSNRLAGFTSRFPDRPHRAL
ncbi:MAG TPA: hypothetical protein VME92_04525 [Acetobacteraceae bacterium]|nr:hypothetical protein [Acetobacteraceae bacterium]